jgi:hydroxypyruvate isomerase
VPRFAANLTMLFTEYPMVERIERAGAAGFAAVEILFPYTEVAAALRAALDRAGVELGDEPALLVRPGTEPDPIASGQRPPIVEEQGYRSRR